MNDAASRSGGRGSGLVPRSNCRAHLPEPEEELETGEPIEDEEQPAPAKKRIRARPVAFTGRSERSTQTEESNSANGQMVLTTAKYMPAQPPEPARRDRKGRPAPEEAPTSFEGKVLNSGKWGGMLAMAVAVIWFMAGMANDMLFYYPPVLFVIGLVAFMKGTVRGE